MVCLGVDPGISHTGLAVVEASPILADFSRILCACMPCQCDVVRIYAIYDGGKAWQRGTKCIQKNAVSRPSASLANTGGVWVARGVRCDTRDGEGILHSLLDGAHFVDDVRPVRRMRRLRGEIVGIKFSRYRRRSPHF